jgi:RNA polymerase sigma-70 factor (ECF subfamily)
MVSSSAAQAESLGLSGQEASAREPPEAAGAAPCAFEDLYNEHVDFVWRSLRRLGVSEAGIDDAVQDVFLVVHRRLGEFEGRSSLKTWLFGIVLRVARTQRRSVRRKSPCERAPGLLADPENVEGPRAERPDTMTEQSEAVRVLYSLLDELGDDKREVFVLAELEQMTAPEIAEALGANVNSVYSRLRAARQEFEKAVLRHRARDEWRYR